MCWPFWDVGRFVFQDPALPLGPHGNDRAWIAPFLHFEPVMYDKSLSSSILRDTTHHVGITLGLDVLVRTEEVNVKECDGWCSKLVEGWSSVCTSGRDELDGDTSV